MDGSVSVQNLQTLKKIKIRKSTILHPFGELAGHQCASALPHHSYIGDRLEAMM